ncbi:MAG: hypothetical protein IKP68_00165 [Clostridia bacterium]|nr:hypothetical protein [Clostridia bacterium]
MNKSTYQNYGYLQINVTSSDGAIPIGDATVAVRLIENGVPRIIAVLLTDESGKTPEIIIETPPVDLSLNPSPDTRPYALVDIETTAFGYYSTANVSVPVFPGVKSVQNINMISLPEDEQGGPSPNVIVFESEAPSL